MSLCPCGGRLHYFRPVLIDDDERIYVRYRRCVRCGRVEEWEDRFVRVVKVTHRERK